VRPGQIFQSGANYKTHVVQLMMASAAEKGDDDPEATRRNATALMEERAANGTPYVFIGLSLAICGPDDNVLLPGIGTQLIAHVSAITPLRPGDLVLTGSPAGNGAHYGRYLQPGDVMEATITGPHVDLGTQRNRCVAP
jgi:2-keto-4-pentenoate hydratase/2-oxohepta-3-ene-1,7-dioic acid hydratase in catechol pathway